MKKTQPYIKEVIREFFHVGLRMDGIIHVCFTNRAEINLQTQIELFRICDDLVEGKRSLIIYEGGELVYVTKKARENAIKMEDQTSIHASVVIVRNLAQKLLADVFYIVNRPKKPFKVFWDFDKGVEWLKSHHIENDEFLISKYD